MEPSEPSEPNDCGRYYADITAPEAAAGGERRPRLPSRRSSNPLPNLRSRRPSIRLLRAPLANNTSTSRPIAEDNTDSNDEPGDYFAGRRRSGSAPVRPTFQPESLEMYEVPANAASSSQARPSTGDSRDGGSTRPGMFTAMGSSARSMLNRSRSWAAEHPSAGQRQPDEYRNDAVDLLDVVGKPSHFPVSMLLCLIGPFRRS